MKVSQHISLQRTKVYYSHFLQLNVLNFENVCLSPERRKSAIDHPVEVEGQGPLARGTSEQLTISDFALIMP